MTKPITLNDFELARYLFAFMLLLGSAHFFGYLFQRFGLTRIVGEIFGGLVLGPTCLGAVSPEAFHWLFLSFPEEGKLVAAIYSLGLALLMFVSGFELQKNFQPDERRTVWGILLGETIPPFAIAWFIASSHDITYLMGPAGNLQALKLVFAIAVAVTSIPFISKIFLDLNILGSRFAKVTLTTATVQDVILWIALSIATALAAGTPPSTSAIARHVAITVAFFLAAFLFMPKFIGRASMFRGNLIAKSSPFAYVLVIMFLFAAIASLLKVNVVFGAFLAGIIVGALPGEQFIEVRSQIRTMAQALFIPIYFAVVGLKLNLLHHFDPLIFAAFFVLSSLISMAGTFLGARSAGKDWFTCFNLAMAMNARGGPGIVLATIAFDQGIINEPFFVTLVLTAIVTSLAAGAWFKYALGRGWELYR